MYLPGAPLIARVLHPFAFFAKGWVDSPKKKGRDLTRALVTTAPMTNDALLDHPRSCQLRFYRDPLFHTQRRQRLIQHPRIQPFAFDLVLSDQRRHHR